MWKFDMYFITADTFYPVNLNLIVCSLAAKTFHLVFKS